MEFDWINLLQVLGGMILGGGGVFGIKAAIRKGKAESEHAQHDADKAEVERLHLQIDHQQKTLETYIKLENNSAARIAELNSAMDGKTEQIRKLTEQVIASEHGRNADKDEVARLNGVIADLKVEVEHYKKWRCEREDCQDPRGAKPPRDRLKGVKYIPPKKDCKI